MDGAFCRLAECVVSVVVVVIVVVIVVEVMEDEEDEVVMEVDVRGAVGRTLGTRGAGAGQTTSDSV